MKAIQFLSRHSRVGGNLGRAQFQPLFNLSNKLSIMVGWIPAYTGMTDWAV